MVREWGQKMQMCVTSMEKEANSSEIKLCNNLCGRQQQRELSMWTPKNSSGEWSFCTKSSVFIAKREFLNEFHVASDFQPVDSVYFILMAELILAWATRHEMNFTLRKLDDDVDVFYWNEIGEMLSELMGCSKWQTYFLQCQITEEKFAWLEWSNGSFRC